ncbi:MAG: hypothetical protein CW338_07365, partial [Clostridiales bacterium]|nr:hypothetical protein [Clostridiales bacterium]
MKKSNLIVNIVGLALVAFVIIMLFVPYFSYPPEVKARDPKVTGIVSGELLDTVTAVKDNLPKESCSIAFYAWRPKEAGQVIDYVAKQYPDLTVSNGSFAIPVAAIMLCGLAAMIFGVIKINKKTPSILFLLFGLICTWAFLYMSPLWLGSFATLLFIVSLVITAGGLVYTVSFLKEKSGSEVFNLVGNLLCAALLIALIFVMFPNTHEGTFLTFTTIDSAADAGASWNFFGSPLLLLIVSVIVLAFSLFKCNRAWPLYAQLVAGLLGMITVLSNPVFSNNVSAMGAGLAASMLLTAISIVRLAIAIIALVNGKAAPAVEEDEETEKAGRKLHIIINLASAALLIALIIVLFTVSAGENFLTFNLRDLGTTPQTNPYLVTPGNKGDFGTQVLASPVLLLIVSVIVLAVSLFKYDREWPMFLQLFTGAAGLYTILSNRAFETNGAGMAIGIIICAILAAAALAR